MGADLAFDTVPPQGGSSRPNSMEDGQSQPARKGRMPSATDRSQEAADRRRELLAQAGIPTPQLAGEGPNIDPEALAGSIEGFVGYARVPVGVFGPIKVRGDHAQGDFFVPLATTEGSVVMSFQHTANVISRAGGIRAVCTEQNVWRVPVFQFDDLDQAVAFADWARGQRPLIDEAIASTSRYCKLNEMHASILGSEVYLRLGFETGDAGGQNMVTLAADAICTRMIDEMPTKPRGWYVESNASGDKKPTTFALQGARGKRVSADVVIPNRLCKRYFQCEASELLDFLDVVTMGSMQSGTVGVQANYANALAGLFIACGQDVACVTEAAIGVTRGRLTDQGDLYLSATLPNLIVGTVGGGTYLPTQAECLEMLGCRGAGAATKFAEICAAVVLLGEVAVLGAVAGGSFARAHGTLGRPGSTGE